MGKSAVIFTALCVSITARQTDFNWTVLPLMPMDSSSYLKKAQKYTINEDGLLGKVLIGNANKPLCVPGNSALTILGRLGKNTKVHSATPCPIDTTATNNLLQRISVNCCLVHPKGSAVPVIVMNQNNYNVWIWQPLLAADIYWVEHLPWDYGVELHPEQENIDVAFEPLAPANIMAAVKAVHDEPETKPSKEDNEEPHPTFGPHPDIKEADFDFQKEVECLLFKLILGDIYLDKEHQAKFIDLIYSNQEVFSLHDEDLGYCD